MLFSPHHISLLTGNASVNAQFYIQVLGLRLVKNSVNQEAIHIRHLYYGNNLGEPGSVITFFVLDRLGQRQEANHGLTGIRIGIPRNTTSYWQKRLETANFHPQLIASGLIVTDPDGVLLTFVEVDRQLTDRQHVPNDVPVENQIVGLLGTNIDYVNYSETVTFYHDWLGLNDFNHQIPLPSSGATITLTSAPDSNHRSRMGRGSVDHIALQVPDQSTLFHYYRRAQSLGLDIELYRDRGWFQSIYVRDPSDNSIELATTAPGFALEEPASTMGQQLSLPPLFADQTDTVRRWYDKHNVKFDEAERFENEATLNQSKLLTSDLR